MGDLHDSFVPLRLWLDGSIFAIAVEPASSGQLRRLARTVHGAAVRISCALLEWQQRARERRKFMSLDERSLRDIGLLRGDIQRF